MESSVNWGLIGYGKFGKKIEDSFLTTKYSKLKAIASRSFEEKNDITEKLSNHKIIYDSHNKLIKDERVDSVYIATTNNFHKELIISSARNKKNIICEKPACLNETDFKECMDEIKKNDVFFMEGLMYLHHPQIFKAIDLIKKGQIGEVKKINSSFGYRIGKKFFFLELKKIDTKSRIFNPLLGGGAIYDLGCYPITAALLFFNLQRTRNKVIKSEFNRDDGRYGVDESADAKLFFESGGEANLKVSIRKDLENTIEIIGNRGKIKILYPWKAPVDSEMKVNIDQEKKIIKTTLQQDIYALEIDNASKAIHNNKKEIMFPAINLDRSLEYIKIMDKWKK